MGLNHKRRHGSTIPVDAGTPFQRPKTEVQAGCQWAAQIPQSQREILTYLETGLEMSPTLRGRGDVC